MRKASGVALAMSMLCLLTAGSLTGATRVSSPSVPLPQASNIVDPSATPDRSTVMIEMADEPSVVVWARSKSSGNAVAAGAARSQRENNRRKQEPVLAAVRGLGNGARVLYQVQRAFNGVVAVVDRKDIDSLKKLPGVKDVYEMVAHERNNSTSVPFLGVPAAMWDGLGLGKKGDGIRVAIIDSGTDYNHANFGGSGNPADYTANNPDVIEPGTFPTAKVVDGWDFVGDLFNNSSVPVATPDPDPRDCGGHGSHVAGTVAGYGVNGDGSTYTGTYDNSIDFASMRIGPGVAPGASIVSYKVFGCSGSTPYTTAAIDRAVDPNDDGDPSDHVDVINMSLGSGFGSGNDSSATASNNAAEAGIIVVTSAGNSYDTFFITGAPGVAARAISTAAVTDPGSVFDGYVKVNSPAAVQGDYFGAAASGTPWPVNGLSGDVALVDDGSTASVGGTAGATVNDGCQTPFLTSVSGKIAFLYRGGCSFQLKFDNAVAEGAIGVIVGNNTATAPNPMAGTSTIPAVMITMAARDSLRAQINGGATINATLFYRLGGDTPGSFSSRGPGREGFLKPDLAAPGVSITSTAVGSGSGAAIFDGTSMASPHVAGFMAILREFHPDWTVEELKALAMNTSVDVTTHPNGLGILHGPSRVGAGRVSASGAATGSVIAYVTGDEGRVSVSFGAVPAAEVTTRTKTIRVANKGTSSATYAVTYQSVVDAPGATVDVSPSSITVAAGATVDVTVTLTLDPAALRHSKDTTLNPVQAGNTRFFVTEESGYVKLIPGEGLTLRVPVHAMPRVASAMAAVPASVPTSGPSGVANITLSGTGVNQSGALPAAVKSLVTALELQVSDPNETGTSGITDNADIQYVGVAADPVATASPWLYFGVSTYGKWFTPVEVGVSIWIDSDQNGTSDFRIWNGAFVENNQTTDVFVSVVGSSAMNYINGFAGASYDTVVHNSNQMVLSVSAASVTLAGDANPAFNYYVSTTSRDGSGTMDTTPWVTYNRTTPGVDFSGGIAGQPTYLDLPGTLPVAYNTASLAANGSLGALLIHHNNATANAQFLPVCTPLNVSPATIPDGATMQSYFRRLSASGGSGNYSFSVIAGALPAGLSLSADGVLSGTPTTAGAFTFTVAATDAMNNCPGTREYTINIVSTAPTVTSIAPFHGPHTGGTSVDLGGTNFAAGTAVTVGGQPVDETISSDTALTFTSPALAPGQLFDVTVTKPDTQSVTATNLWLTDFLDVTNANIFYEFVADIAYNRITAGCGAGNYCPGSNTPRDQMAAFVSRAMAGGDELIPVTGTVGGNAYSCQAGGTSLFNDVPAEGTFCRHIHYIASAGVTAGCAPGLYCGAANTLRSEMAVFIARAKAGSDAAVPTAVTVDGGTGLNEFGLPRAYDCTDGVANAFSDVDDASSICRHVYYIWARGIVDGTVNGTYEPNVTVPRDAMAKFLSNAF